MISSYNARRLADAKLLRSRALDFISKSGALSVPQIAEKTNKTKSNIYSVVKALMLSGDIVQSGSYRDKDNRLVTLYSATGNDRDFPILTEIINKAKRIKGPFASMIAQMQVHQQKELR